MKYKLTNAQKECQEALDGVEYATIIKSIRSGKTLTILDYCVTRGIKKVLWVAPFLDNLTSLEQEVEKWGIKLDITTTTYQSIKKYSEKSYDLVVLDECHKITSLSTSALLKVNYTKLICMTGTYPKKTLKKALLEHNLKCKIVFKYTVKDAVTDHLVAPYKIFLVAKELSKEKTIHVKTKTHDFWTSEASSYASYQKKIDDEQVESRKRILLFSMMRFLNTLDTNIEYVKKYIEKNERNNKRVLIFVATQQMAEQCSKYCYYGGKEDTYFKQFQNREINHLVLVEKAAIGVTYENLDGCLLTTINGSSSSVLQKIFRTILWRPDYEARIEILINEGTPQERWIKKALNNE